VTLVDTAARNARGSMSRYADLVSQALGERPGSVQATRVFLSAPTLLTRYVPPRLAPWAQHVWILGTARRRLRRCSPSDLLHVVDGSHGYLVPATKGRKLVITVHDVIPLLQSLGEIEGPRPSRLARGLWRRTLQTFRTAERLIADSRRTADDLIRHGNVRPDRVVVVSPAVATIDGDEPLPTADGSRFILHVGNGAFYKNRPAVLRVFAAVRRRFDVRLRVAGAPPDSGLRSLAGHLGIAEVVDWVPDADDATLGRLYRRASLLLFPSLYEGFGWPPLEAMSVGCPVVCSTAASLPEVVGDAALACAPEDEGGLVERVTAILDDPGLGLRLAARGRERAALFSLERMAAGLIEAYRGAAGEAA
jgi:glycosyltransferase involved in cell wall biosynthesis